MNKKKTKNIIDIIINCILVLLLIVLFIYYLQGTNYTKTMIVIQSDNTQTIVREKYTNKTIILDYKNKLINSKCEITFNDNNTSTLEDDTIVRIKWLDNRKERK